VKYALFQCCYPRVFYKLGESINLLFEHLGVEFVPIKDFNCCGYPAKNIDFLSYVTASARNIALAARARLDLLTYCSCCYGSMKQVQHIMDTNAVISEKVRRSLKKEGLAYAATEIKHYLQVCYHDIGLEKMAQRVKKPFQGMKVAVHHGCHLLRPRQIANFDHPTQPVIYDRLIGVTGAESINWSDKLTCCGAPIWGSNDEMSMNILQRKISNARQAGADVLCTACANCQLQFDKVQKMMVADRGLGRPMPSLSFIQLLGLSLGLDPASLDLDSQVLQAVGTGASCTAQLL
jgi:heterodisulfide reductase subunit B